MEEGERFRQLRRILAVEQPEEIFAFLEAWPEGAERELAIEYAYQHLNNWSSRLLRLSEQSDTQESRFGLEWANQLIDKAGLRLHIHRDAISFAKIIVGFFPKWFEFRPETFAVHAWERGLKLVVSGSGFGMAVFPTSSSRCMSGLLYHRQGVEHARMDMHYTPSAEQAERARLVVTIALHQLFPEQGPAPLPSGSVIPEGQIFPE